MIREYLYWFDALGDLQEQSFTGGISLNDYIDECWPNTYVPELWNCSWCNAHKCWFWYSNKKYQDNFPQSDSLCAEDESSVPKPFRMLQLLK